MMEGKGEVQARLAAAGAALDRAAARLGSASTRLMEECAGELAGALEHLREAEQSLRAEPVEEESRFQVRRDVLELAARIRRLERLVAHAAGFYEGWRNLLCPAEQRYGPTGQAEVIPIAGPRPGQIHLNG